MEYVDGQLVAVRDRMQEAKETDGESRTQVLQDVITLCRLLSLTSSPQFRQLFKRKQEEASVKSHEKNSQFKVVSNKRDSVLANTGHPAGWVNRTAEREEKAVQGTEWRSEAYVLNHSRLMEGEANRYLSYRRFTIV